MSTTTTGVSLHAHDLATLAQAAVIVERHGEARWPDLTDRLLDLGRRIQVSLRPAYLTDRDPGDET